MTCGAEETADSGKDDGACEGTATDATAEETVTEEIDDSGREVGTFEGAVTDTTAEEAVTEETTDSGKEDGTCEGAVTDGTAGFSAANDEDAFFEVTESTGKSAEAICDWANEGNDSVLGFDEGTLLLLTVEAARLVAVSATGTDPVWETDGRLFFSTVHHNTKAAATTAVKISSAIHRPFVEGRDGITSCFSVSGVIQ